MVTAVRQTKTIEADTLVEAVVDLAYGDAVEPEPLTAQALEQTIWDGGRQSAPTKVEHAEATAAIEARQRTLTPRWSIAAIYDLWIASWETALAALATASQAGTLRTSEAAAHRAAILAEREIVTRQLRLLAGADRFAKTR